VSLLPSAHLFPMTRPVTRQRADVIPEWPAVGDGATEAQPMPMRVRVSQTTFVPAPPMLKCLIIDDDPFVGAAIKTIMARQGWEMVLSSRAHAGINAFESSAFDLVLVDLFMPGMNGFDTILRIRQLAPTVPIVAMSGFEFSKSDGTSQDFLGLAVQRGANCGVRKPFSQGQLMAAINSTLAPPRIGWPPR